MKKRLLVLMLSVLLVFGLAACGGGDSGGGSAATPIQDYLDENGAEIQEAFDEMALMLGMGEGSRVVVSANDADNELIFSFYFGEFEQEGLNDDMLGRSSAALSTLGPIFEPMAEEIRDEIGVDSLVLTIVLLSSEGNESMRTSIEA